MEELSGAKTLGVSGSRTFSAESKGFTQERQKEQRQEERKDRDRVRKDRERKDKDRDSKRTSRSPSPERDRPRGRSRERRRSRDRSRDKSPLPSSQKPKEKEKKDPKPKPKPKDSTSRRRSRSPSTKRRSKKKQSSSCRNGHHADCEPQLSAKERDRIRHVPALLELYDFIDSVAGSDRRHYRKCGCVNKMPISHLWNMDTKNPVWRWHDKTIDDTKIRFEENFGYYLTGTGRAAVEHAFSVVRTCGNSAVKDLKLFTLITDRDLKPQFRGLVSMYLQTGKDPKNWQSVSTLAVKEIIDTETYYLTWFMFVKPQPVLDEDGEMVYRWVVPSAP